MNVREASVVVGREVCNGGLNNHNWIGLVCQLGVMRLYYLTRPTGPGGEGGIWKWKRQKMKL